MVVKRFFSDIFNKISVQSLACLCLYLAGFALYYLRFIKHYFFMRDDVYFYRLTNNYGLLDYVLMRYETWSSRSGIEGAVWLFCKILRFSDVMALAVLSLCFILVYYGLSYLIKPQNFLQRVTIFLFIYGVPNVYFSNSGWFTTILYYVFPLGLGTFALGAIRDIADGKKISRLKTFLYVFATLVAGNMEQYAFILGAVLILAIGWFFYYKKRIVKVLVAEFFCVVFDIGIFLTCEGNRQRYLSEMADYWRDFNQVSVIEKMYNGICHCLDVFFFDGFILSLLFLLISLFAVAGFFWCKKRHILSVWGMSAVIFFIILFGKNYQLVSPMVHNDLGYTYLAPLMLFFSGGYFLAVVYRFKFEFWFYIAILGIGVCSAVLIGFSPTLYASNIRVFIGLIFVLMYLALRFWIGHYKKLPYCNLIMFLYALYWAYCGLMVNNVL